MKLQATAHALDAEGATLVRVAFEASDGPIVADYLDPVEALNDACAFVETALDAIRRRAVALA